MSTPVLYEAPHDFDIAWVRKQFPSLQLQVNGQPAAFLAVEVHRGHRVRLAAHRNPHRCSRQNSRTDGRLTAGALLSGGVGRSAEMRPTAVAAVSQRHPSRRCSGRRSQYSAGRRDRRMSVPRAAARVALRGFGAAPAPRRQCAPEPPDKDGRTIQRT